MLLSVLAFVSSTDTETYTTPSDGQAWRLIKSACNSGSSLHYQVYRNEVFDTQLCMLDGTPAAGRLVMTVTAIADIGADLESLLVSFGCCTTQPTS